MLSDRFISATREYCTFDRHVAAPCMRKSFRLEELPALGRLTICGLGLYRVFLNGEEITASYLAPYISNPDKVMYYNEYDISQKLCRGENVIAVLLGNGFLNNIGGYIWEFDKAAFRSAPKVAFALELDGNVTEADESVKVHPSAITFDDMRAGERYDARMELPGWTEIGFDDSGWDNAIPAETPKGEKRICNVEPIRVEREVPPVSVTEGDGGYIYDFGVNTAGIARLKIHGACGQQIKLVFTEVVNDGKADLRNINFGSTRPDYNQCVIYTCKSGENVYTPSFCYMGYRYIYVSGITREQATEDLLTMLKTHSDVRQVCSFSCSDSTLNRLYENVLNSTVSNLWFVPTDCPQREKNGWTGDMNLSAEHMLLNFDCEKTLREWMFNIRKAQMPNGKLPCVIPTAGWGYEWGPGPAWDAALVEMTYRIYQFTGHKEVIYENGDAIFRYIQYMQTRRDENGLTAYGLGDWCQVDLNAADYTTPLQVSDTLTCAQMCRKAADLFGAVGESQREAYCKALSDDLITCFRTACIQDDLTVMGGTQTGQAMALYYGAFREEEKAAAFAVLRRLVKEKNDHFDVGVLGARVLFRVLADFGEWDLSYKLIAQPTFPSFGYHIGLGATSLFESFYRLNQRFEIEDGRRFDVLSHNHHFWGDIGAFFVEYIAGLQINPSLKDIHEVVIVPCPVTGITWAKCSREMPYGTIAVEWRRKDGVISLNLDIPEGTTGTAVLPNGERKALKPGRMEYSVTV